MTEGQDPRLAEYQQTNDPQLRQELVVYYAPLVKKQALRLRSSFDKLSDLEDVVQEGILVLMRTLDSFDPARGIPFESYAALRVRGGMLDYLRGQYWAPRSVHQKAREISEARQTLAQRLGREPLPAELAEELGISLEAYSRTLQKISSMTVLSLDTAFYEPESEEGFSLAATGEENPELVVQQKMVRERLANAIRSLPEKEQTVLSLYYAEGLKAKEIAELLGVSVPRVSQIHHRALLRLRGILEP